MKKFHVLNGDCLAEQLKETDIGGNTIICRECLIGGEVKADNLKEFWLRRAAFIIKSYTISVDDYFERSVKEFEKLQFIPEGSEVYLWFENDLFCQTNMWFIIHLLAKRTDIRLYRVFPTINNDKDIWKGFSLADVKSLKNSYQNKRAFSKQDILLGSNLWKAYQNDNFIELIRLSKQQSECFEHLEEVCQAHIDRFPTDNSLGKPERIITEILEKRKLNFNELFTEFSEIAGIYGFGDSQLKAIYDQMLI